MSKGQKLRALVNERLTAAAEEIFELFERTIAEYEEEVHRVKQRNNTQQQLLDQVLEPRVVLHKTGVQFVSVKREEELGPSLEPVHIKQEPEEEQISVKTDEDKSSVLHQRPTEENREEPNGADCGAEAGCSSDPLTHLHSDSYSSSDTDGLTLDRTQSREPPDDSEQMETEGLLLSEAESQKNALIRSGQVVCSVCKKVYRDKGTLKVHMRTHTGEKPFRCSVCQKCFTQKTHLLTHMRIHTGEEPFSCSECTARFKYKLSLDCHVRAHRGEKPFSCPICKRGFTKKSLLTPHMRIHTGEKPFSCPFCSKRFRQKQYFRSHIKTHTTREQDFNTTLHRHMLVHSEMK